MLTVWEVRIRWGTLREDRREVKVTWTRDILRTTWKCGRLRYHVIDGLMEIPIVTRQRRRKGRDRGPERRWTLARAACR